MDKKEFLYKFKEILEIENQDVKFEDNFRYFPEWDSLAVLSVTAMINEQYDITIPRQKFKNVSTIGELYELIERKK